MAADERFVDDRHTWCRRAIPCVEGSPTKDANPHRGEIGLADDVPFGDVTGTGGILCRALDGVVVGHHEEIRRKSHGRRDRPHTRQRAQSVFEADHECLRLLSDVVRLIGQRQTEGDHALRAKAGIGLLEVEEALDH